MDTRPATLLRACVALLAIALCAPAAAHAGNPLKKLKKKKFFDVDETPAAFREIRGQDPVIRELITFGKSIVQPEIFAQAGIRADPATRRTAILYGPPGTGKTSLVRALARYLNGMEETGNRKVELLEVDVNTLLDPYVGETEKKIRDEFDKASKIARKKGRIVLLYLDEIDKLAQRRSDGSGEAKAPSPALHQLLAILGNAAATHENVIPVASTNVVSEMDAAVLRRFGWPIAVPNPTKRGRHAVTDYYSELMNLRNFWMPARAGGKWPERLNRWIALRRIARKTFHMSGADLERVARMAGLMGVDRRGLDHVAAPAASAEREGEVAEEGEPVAAAPTPEAPAIPITVRDFKDAISRYWLIKETESVKVPKPRRPLHEKNVVSRVLRHPYGVRAGAVALAKDVQRARLGVPHPDRMKGAPSEEQIARERERLFAHKKAKSDAKAAKASARYWSREEHRQSAQLRQAKKAGKTRSR
ncbi:MAG TPA: ATP-binding protein [Kofleriaceae bacterium]|nr:ATP-binding protein [Kofleriaceae bacterium]